MPTMLTALPQTTATPVCRPSVRKGQTSSIGLGYRERTERDLGTIPGSVEDHRLRSGVRLSERCSPPSSGSSPSRSLSS